MSNVETYNPSNATNLSDEDKQKFQSLSKEDVAELAKAYPNTAQNNNYLLLFDKRLPADKQIFQLSSWANLEYLYKLGQDHFIPYGFRGQESTQTIAQPAQAPAKTTVDLSEADVQNAEGLKQAPVVDLNDGLNAGLRDEKETTDPTIHGDVLAPVEKKVAGTTVLQEPVEAGSKLQVLEGELEQLKKDGAHHMTIKAKEKQIAELKGE